jgi:hypothetical protein
VKIPVSQLADLIHEEHGPEWTVIQDELTGRWRWGIHKTIIVRFEDQLYGYDYMVETSHEDYRIVDCDENIEVELWPAVAVSVAKIEYRKKPKGGNGW